jgi:uncharacterized membrane protein YfcA
MEVSGHVFAILVAVAAIAGFIDAIAGGGGLLTLPALLAAGLPPVTAIATSKLQSSCGATMATLAYARMGQVNFRAMAPAAAAAFIGAGLGSLTVQHIDPGFLKGLVPILLVGLALYFLLAPKLGDAERPHRIGPKTYALVALALGFYDGFFGPGTGAFLVVSLILLMGLHLVSATANTKFLNLTSNLGSLLVMALGGHIIVPLGLGMAVGGMIGGQLGAMTAIKVGPRIIRPLLVVVSLGLTIRLLLQPGNPLAHLIWRH